MVGPRVGDPGLSASIEVRSGALATALAAVGVSDELWGMARGTAGAIGLRRRSVRSRTGPGSCRRIAHGESVPAGSPPRYRSGAGTFLESRQPVRRPPGVRRGVVRAWVALGARPIDTAGRVPRPRNAPDLRAGSR